MCPKLNFVLAYELRRVVFQDEVGEELAPRSGRAQVVAAIDEPDVPNGRVPGLAIGVRQAQSARVVDRGTPVSARRIDRPGGTKHETIEQRGAKGAGPIQRQALVRRVVQTV